MTVQASATPKVLERRSLRVPFLPDGIRLIVTGDDGQSQMLETNGLNLSQGGVALMTMQEVSAGLACQVELPALDGTTHRLAGKTRDSVQIQGEYYELGITLKHWIDLAMFVELTPEQRLVYIREQSDLATHSHQPDEPAPAMISQAIDKAYLRPLIREYLGELQQCIDRLQAAAAAGDRFTLKRITQWIHGSAESFGFPALTEAAELFQNDLSRLADAEAQEIKNTARSFTDLLQCACRSTG